MSETTQYGQLGINIELGAAQILIHVRGEVDLSNAIRVQEAIDSACEDKSARAIILDLSGLEFIDSTGLSVMVGATRRSRRNGNRLNVRGADGQVLRILEIAGVHDWLLRDGDSADGESIEKV